jgi:hypothetical protein
VPLLATRARPRQQLEAPVEVLRDLAGRQRADPRRRELDRQRQPVQPLADVRHGLGVAVAQIEVPDREPRPVREHLHRLGAERAERDHLLALHAERLAARGHDAHVGHRLDHALHEVGRALQHVLAVVQHEQQVAAVEHLGYGGRSIRTRVVAPEGGRHGRRHRLVRPQRRQLAPAHLEVQLAGDLRGKPRLARPADPG